MEIWILCELLLLACSLPSHVLGKECTNSGVPQSHTLRYQMSTSKNSTRKAGMHSHHSHLNPTEESTWMNLMPRKLLRTDAANRDFDWASLYRSIKGSDGQAASPGDFLKEFSLHNVRLDPDSKHGRAQQTNLEYLLMLDVDQLVWSFRKQAGLPTPGKPYGGWEAPDVELRGHFVGHYLSASAKMWASTRNDTLHQKMSALVDALDVCQKKMGTGYLSAFPTELFDRFEALKPVWAPYYTIHKIMAGLLDQYIYAGNDEALQMLLWMTEYFENRVKNVIAKYSIERHWLSLNEETGGMNDVLYDLYSITGDQKHLVLAHLFDKPCFLGLLAVQADTISGFHANTHIPVVIGAQRRYEITGDPLYKDIGTYFMGIINSSHSYATGGTSYGEFWSDPKRLADTLKIENEETCTTYNMLKVSRNLFKWTKEMNYADYYERALTNGVLSIQRGTDPGIMIYMLPMGVGVSKGKSYHSWGTKFNSFWCCYGTGIESFSKLGDSIYFEQDTNIPILYIIQYISSSLNWKSGGLIVNQRVEPVASSDPYLRVAFTFSSNQPMAKSSEVRLRVPFWTASNGAKATVNDEYQIIPSPGNFLSLTRTWTSNDKLILQLPIHLRTEPISDDRTEYASVQAILFGPYLLAGLTGGGDWDIKTGDAADMSDWIRAVPSDHNSQLITLTQDFGGGSLVFSNHNDSITMEEVPYEGSDASIHATFRAILAGASSNVSGIDLGSRIMLEPLDLPGMVVAAGGPNGSLAIISGAGGPDSTYRVAAGLDGKEGTVSLESTSRPGCYLHGAAAYSAGGRVQLLCEGRGRSRGGASPEAASRGSFTLRRGMRAYDPISFVARGAKRNFLLEPLLGLRDESYTVYFNIGV